MIIKGLVSLVLGLLDILLSVINLPGLDQSTIQSVYDFLDRLFDITSEFIGFFVPWGVVQALIVPLILILNIDHIYHLFMWILKKIPMLGIE